MDPKYTLQTALERDSHIATAAAKQAAKDYNGWASTGGFRARVELHPATDLWMAGARYGEAEKVTDKFVYVKLDATGKTVRVAHENIGRVL